MMTEKEVIELLKSSKNEVEWRENREKVRKSCYGLPSYWYHAVLVASSPKRLSRIRANILEDKSQPKKKTKDT